MVKLLVQRLSDISAIATILLLINKRADEYIRTYTTEVLAADR